MRVTERGPQEWPKCRNLLFASGSRTFWNKLCYYKLLMHKNQCWRPRRPRWQRPPRHRHSNCGSGVAGETPAQKALFPWSGACVAMRDAACGPCCACACACVFDWELQQNFIDFVIENCRKLCSFQLFQPLLAKVRIWELFSGIPHYIPRTTKKVFKHPNRIWICIVKKSTEAKFAIYFAEYSIANIDKKTRNVRIYIYQSKPIWV